MPDPLRLARCSAIAILLGLAACSQDSPPLGPVIKGAQRTPGTPVGWLGFTNATYEVGRDRTNQRQGAEAAYIRSLAAEPSGFASIFQNVRADHYRSQRVRWSAWVRHSGITGGGAGLWLRVDGPGTREAFDNMSDRPITGTSGWHEVSVVLDVPANAIGLAAGVLLNGPGDLVFDDVRLERVTSEVPSTDQLTGPQASPSDSATIAAVYAYAPDRPVNLDFEGMPAPSSLTVDWLKAHTIALTSADPGANDGDLEPLRAMVGSARVVALGEATHGTREFFQLKHRVFQFLVREMGFTHFAIEATWPEANDLNRYVLTGEGDPARLLSNLYFWTWNTQEVRDLINWMREWNAAASVDRQVQFLGFDMQFPGAAMDTVASFIARVDPTRSAFVSERLECIVPYRNVHEVTAHPASGYAALPAAIRNACRDGLQDVYALIRDRRAEYTAASAEAIWANALWSARLVQQFEECASTNSFGRPRDGFMAENVIWLLDQAGPQSRMMLWAHNGHVARASGTMGDSLARAYGEDYVNLGFAFGTGRFNAFGPDYGLRAWEATLVPSGSMESFFLATDSPLLLFDTRTLAAGGAAAAPLRERISMRSIGALFDPAREAAYFVWHLFPDNFDLLIYVAETSESTLLPFRY